MNPEARALILRLAAAAPPLSPAVRLRLAAILRPGPRTGISEGNKRNDDVRKAAA